METCDALAELRTAFDLAICELEFRVNRVFPGWMKLLQVPERECCRV